MQKSDFWQLQRSCRTNNGTTDSVRPGGVGSDKYSVQMCTAFGGECKMMKCIGMHNKGAA